MPTSICQWITNFLTDRQQLVRLGKFTSNTCTISTGAPQGCVFSSLLFSLYTNDFTSTDPSVKLLKFADGTTVISLIQDSDESTYRRHVLVSHNNLDLNMLKTVEIILDFIRNIPALPSLTIMNSTVASWFLGSSISSGPEVGVPDRLHWEKCFASWRSSSFHRSCLASYIQPSVLCTSVVVWFSSATKSEAIRRLQWTVRTAEMIISHPPRPVLFQSEEEGR